MSKSDLEVNLKIEFNDLSKSLNQLKIPLFILIVFKEGEMISFQYPAPRSDLLKKSTHALRYL